jgi:hypothetical protein
VAVFTRTLGEFSRRAGDMTRARQLPRGRAEPAGVTPQGRDMVGRRSAFAHPPQVNGKSSTAGAACKTLSAREKSNAATVTIPMTPDLSYRAGYTFEPQKRQCRRVVTTKAEKNRAGTRHKLNQTAADRNGLISRKKPTAKNGDGLMRKVFGATGRLLKGFSKHQSGRPDLKRVNTGALPL